MRILRTRALSRSCERSSSVTGSKIHLLLFAAFREAAGFSRLELEVNSGATVEDVFDLLEKRHPHLAELRPFTTFAVNREVVSPDTTLHAGDEVAFLQPASGGAR